MPYQIHISKNEKSIFRTHQSCAWTVQSLKALVTEIDAKFPEADGYVIAIERFHRFGPSLSRSTFKMASATEDPTDILKLFVSEEKFRSFKEQKTRCEPEEIKYLIDDVENYEHVETVIVYKDDYYLLQQSAEQKYRYLLTGDRPILSNNLLELEYELFLSFLQDCDC